MKLAKLAVIGLLTLAFGACGGGSGSGSNGGGSVAVTGVLLNKCFAGLSVGSDETLIETVLPSNAANKAIVWESSDDTVVTIVDGAIHGVAPGTAEITVTADDGGKFAVCAVKVVTSIELRVVYSMNNFIGNTSSIYSMKTDGGDKIVLTSSSAGEELYRNPKVSPDSSVIVFQSGYEKSSTTDILKMNSNGTGKTNLTTSAGSPNSYHYPAISPDGTKILHVNKDDSTGINYICTMDLSGNSRQMLAQLLIANYLPYKNPVWSADGSSVVFENVYMYYDTDTEISYSNINIMNNDGTGIVDLTKTTTNNDFYTAPCVSPDGKRIVYGFFNKTSNTGGIYVMNMDGSGHVLLKACSGVESYSNPSWSFDGKKIVFESFYEDLPNSAIYKNVCIMDSGGGSFVNITGNTTNLLNFAEPCFIQIFN